jgi:hypothetical protein
MDQTDVCDRKEMESKGLKEAFSCAPLEVVDKHPLRRYSECVVSVHLALPDSTTAIVEFLFKVYFSVISPVVPPRFVTDVTLTILRILLQSQLRVQNWGPKEPKVSTL